MVYYEVDIFGLFMKGVVADFILNPQKDQNAAGHADGQPKNVDKRITQVIFQVPQSKFHVVFEHRILP